MLLKIYTFISSVLFMDTIVNHTSQSYDVQNRVFFSSLFFWGGEKNKCQKHIKSEPQHKYEMTSCESEILDGLIY